MKRIIAIAVTFLITVAIGFAERLKFAELQENEVIVVDFLSTGCFHHVSRQYLIRGGQKKIFTATDQTIEWRNGTSYVTGKELLGDIELSTEDTVGLDALMVFYRAELKGACTTRDIIRVDYFRESKLISREEFHDETCITHFSDTNELVVSLRGRFEPALLREIVSFTALDQKVRDLNGGDHAAESKSNSKAK